MRGRLPKPAALVAAEGDTRRQGKAKMSARVAAEPKPNRGLPDPPQHLTGLARETWLNWAEQLEVMDLDRKCDAAMLEGACSAYARAVAADAIIEREGFIAQHRDGIRKHPAAAISAEAWKQVKAFCTEFGFSPVSRARVAANGTPAPSKADLMNLLLGDDEVTQ